VCTDLQAVRREWRDSRIRDFDEAVNRELAKVDRLEREAWNAWQRSREPLESTRVVSDGAGGKTAQKVVRQRDGDPRFLEQVHKCIATRRALLGLDAPTRIAPTSPDGQQAYHSHVMMELMRLAEQAKSGPAVVDGQVIAEQVRLASREEGNDDVDKREG